MVVLVIEGKEEGCEVGGRGNIFNSGRKIQMMKNDIPRNKNTPSRI